MLSRLRQLLRPLLAGACAAALLAPGPAHAAETTSPDFPRSHLWRIEKPGQPASWLFGTAHVSDPQVTRLSPAVQAAFDGAERIATEVRLDFGAFMEQAHLVLLPEGESLKDLLGPEHYARLVPELEARHYPEAATRRLKPWAAAMYLMAPRNPTGQLPLDLMLAKNAVESSKAYDGIETVAEQLAVFSEIPADKQLTLLKVLIDHQRAMEAGTKALIGRYVARDYPGMLRLAQPQSDPLLQAFPAADRAFFIDWSQRVLLAERNVRLAERMIKALPQGGAFFAVGALHLPGKDGLVARLRAAGYKVTPADLDKRGGKPQK
ncbi:TraB/GumN family protein [Chitiniphilus purpureus]|uniref:TraB/GumN family protein n=1 Tax=Chitiniphilus purpureus TaxID=2981137 RepID=A0ABY6DJS3_9NEIS|nr:TraB/GumN family protein [Chitiniphilus sp. CD1]UXY14614.1 TraB/GumN family protein [Chitiniphilus sp. CD1]